MAESSPGNSFRKDAALQAGDAYSARPTKLERLVYELEATWFGLYLTIPGHLTGDGRNDSQGIAPPSRAKRAARNVVLDQYASGFLIQ